MKKVEDKLADMIPTIPLRKLNCHHCKLWKQECPGVQYKNLAETGDTYCVQIFQNYSEEAVDGKEFDWLEIPNSEG